MPHFRPPEVPRFDLPQRLRDAVRDLPRLEVTDHVSCSLAPALVQDRKVRMLIVAEAERELILCGECTELHDQERIMERLLSAYQGRNVDRRVGVPREIQTDSRWFYEGFKDALGEIEVRVACFENIPALERLRDSFSAFLGRPGGSGQTDPL